MKIETIRTFFAVLTLSSLSSPVFADPPKQVPTRFGLIEYKRPGPDDNNTELKITHRGRPIPGSESAANDIVGFSPAFQLQTESEDIIVFEGTPGQICPNSVHVLVVKAAGARFVERTDFGCGGIHSISRRGDEIQLTVYGFAGAMASSAEQEKASRRLTTYKYLDGKVTRGGARR